MARKTLSDKGVAALKARPQRYAFPDPQLTGHYVRVHPSGAKSFCAVARTPTGKQVWSTVGPIDVMSIEEARIKARDIIKRVRSGLPPVSPKGETFRDVAENWLKRHVRAKGLRSEHEIIRLLNTHIFPVWENREFLGIRRSDITALLDEIEDDHGARQADYVLAIVRGIANWYASRRDDYNSPVTRGMRRTNPKERARERVLSDDEIRAVWRAAESNGAFGAMVRLALLTAQRRDKIATMRWDDVAVDGTWTIPAADREKGTPGILGLPKAAIGIIRAQTRLGDNAHVFAGRGKGHANGFSKGKRLLDAKLPANTPQWQFHDLRRTARSLMSRAGVRPEIAERVMGHAIAGVEGVYDRHSYRDEKADALKRLAALIESIVSPQDNVTMMRARGRRQ